MFDKHTRMRLNVSGKLGKMKLNPILMEHIKLLVFQHWPLEERENEAREWSQCIVEIDEKNRRLYNKPNLVIHYIHDPLYT